MSRPKIMVVDETTELAETVESALDRLGVEVVTRAVAVGAGAAIARERPALVLVSAELPLVSSPDIGDSLRRSVAMRGAELWLVSDRTPEALDETVRTCGAAAVVPRGSGGEAVAAIRRFLAKRAAAPVLGERRGRMPEILVAARAETCAWARHLLRAHAVVRGTDSGTEALGRMTAKSPPDAVLLGTGLLDLTAVAVWSHATRVDDRWRRRIIVVEEVGHASRGEEPAEMLYWTPRQPESFVLSWLGLPDATR